MKSLKKLKGGLLLAAVLAVLVLNPNAILAKTVTPSYLHVRFPMEDDDFLELYNPAGLSNYSKISYTVYKGTTKIGALRNDKTASIQSVKIHLDEALITMPETYTLKVELVLNRSHDEYERPSGSGWGVNFGPLGALSDFGYRRQISASNVSISEKAEVGPGQSYVLTFDIYFQVLNKIDTIVLSASSGLNLSHGDQADYGFTSDYMTWYKVDSSSPIEWYPQNGGDSPDPVYSENPLGKSDTLVGGQFYKVKIPVSFGTADNDYGIYCGLYSKTALTASALHEARISNGGTRYQWSNWDGREDKYDQNTHVYTVVFERIPVLRPVETLNISGIVSPQAGQAPAVNGLAFSTPDINSLTPYTLSETWTDDNNTKKGVWSGTFDKDGKFISGNHYVLTVACEITGLDFDLYSFDGFAKNAIKTNAGTVESAVTNSHDVSIIKIGFDCPGTTPKEQTGEDGTKPTVAPETTTVVPETTTVAPETTTVAPETTTVAPETTVPLSQIEKVILSLSNDKDPAQAMFSLLQAQGTPKSKTSVKLSWKSVKGATRYVIYGNKCGKKNKYKKIKEIAAKKWTHKKLKKGTYYKYLIVAVKGDAVLSISKTIHVATKGGKVGNHTKVTLNKKKVTIKKGRSKTIKARLKSTSIVRKHRKVAFESDDPKVASVSKNGRIKAVGKGQCYIYAYAQNGLFAKCKVRVN